MKNIINKKSLIIIISVIIVIIIMVGFIKFIYPKSCISNINNNYSIQNYDKVVKYKSKLDFIKNYLKNDDEFNKINCKLKISEAIIEIENSNFKNALDSINNIEISDEVLNNKINELLDEIHYNLAVEFLEDEDYKQAKEEIEQVKNNEYEKLQETKNNIYYEYAKQCFDKKDYEKAIVMFEKTKDYKESKTYINKSYIEQAESCIDYGNFKQAKKIYNSLPNKFKYNGIKVSTRKKQIKNIESVLKVIGKKEATKSYCQTKNVWKYDGRWDSWYIDEPSPLEYIELDLKLNDDGTFNLYGEVNFYAFDDFSTLQEYCVAKIVSKSIEMKNIKKIPATYKIDKYTKLLYSDGKFKIKYSEKDNYSINFYNLYTSTVTY